ncbi:Panacea domain-containing protein [Planktothricoides raciborskii]|uniref:Panacea domain-containing protein n=2 Tax=Planktothricoides raciborskii TaxID=132608 RepID=UPI0035C88A6E
MYNSIAGRVNIMATVYDVAAYILTKKHPLTAVKLQKLLYYAQAWALVWDKKPLFPERIEAWVNGPVLNCMIIIGDSLS